jgi:TatD DNase family protein
MFIDSHCHLDRIDLQDFEQDFSQLLDAARSNQVERMLCVSITLEDYGPMRRLVEPYAHIDLSVGVHPCHTPEQGETVDLLVKMGQDDRVVAVGETGLDYYYSAETKAEQQASFRDHIRAACRLGKPIIVHTRDARQDTLDILREEGAEQCGGVLHCFTESWEMAREALELGFYISFSGIVTFKNAAELREVARQVPDDRFLIETDSPYLAPVPHRGKQNHPAWVKHVAECLAEVRGSSLESVAELSRNNYLRLFRPQEH